LASGNIIELMSFVNWLTEQAPRFDRVIMVAGNHDVAFQTYPNLARRLLTQVPNLTYLEDSGTQLDEGFNVWGSPWTEKYQGWAFNREPGKEMDTGWKLVPEDTHILLTHSPAKGILDPGPNNKKIGCARLARRLGPKGNLKSVRLHVFGHSHDGYGQEVHNGVLHVNAALCNAKSFPTKEPIVIDYPDRPLDEAAQEV